MHESDLNTFFKALTVSDPWMGVQEWEVCNKTYPCHAVGSHSVAWQSKPFSPLASAPLLYIPERKVEERALPYTLVTCHGMCGREVWGDRRIEEFARWYLYYRASTWWLGAPGGILILRAWPFHTPSNTPRVSRHSLAINGEILL